MTDIMHDTSFTKNANITETPDTAAVLSRNQVPAHSTTTAAHSNADTGPHLLQGLSVFVTTCTGKTV